MYQYLMVTKHNVEHVGTEALRWTGEFETNDADVTTFNLKTADNLLPDILVTVTHIEPKGDGEYRGQFECLEPLPPAKQSKN